MAVVDPEVARSVVSAVFESHGVPYATARLVATELVEAERAGVSSHGLIRVAEYLAELDAGRIRLTDVPELVQSDNGCLVVDGHNQFGIVTAHAALEFGLECARQKSIAVVVARNCNHVNRLGSYAERAAEQGFLCFACAALGKPYHVVAPWGGVDARLGTNPIAFGIPSVPVPIVADFATSVVPEGRVRVALASDGVLPPGVAIAADGRPAASPADFYGPPRGALLPFGGRVGHKGYALSVLVEALGGTLGGDAVDDTGRQVNGLFMLLLDPSTFRSDESAAPFEHLSARLADWLRASPPARGVDTVRVPGDLEEEARARHTDHLDIADRVWQGVCDLAPPANVTAAAINGKAREAEADASVTRPRPIAP